MGDSNMYSAGAVSAEEVKRLERQAAGHLLEVSQQAIGDPKGITILDAAAGPSPLIGEWVRKMGGDYIALDVSQAVLEKQREAGNKAIVGNVEQLPADLGPFDVIHQRLTLMHLPFPRRQEVIRQLVKRAKRTLFIEPNWKAFGRTTTTNCFFNLMSRFAKGRADIFLGATLHEEVEQALGSSNARVTGKPSPIEFTRDYKWLQDMLKTFRAQITADESELAEEAVVVAQLLAKEIEKDEPDHFVMPELVIVEVRM